MVQERREDPDRSVNAAFHGLEHLETRPEAKP